MDGVIGWAGRAVQRIAVEAKNATMPRNYIQKRAYRLVVALGLIMPLLACTLILSTKVREAKFIALEFTKPSTDRDISWLNHARPNNEPFLRIAFSSKTDLFYLAENGGFNVSYSAYYCPNGELDTTKGLGTLGSIEDDSSVIEKHYKHKPRISESSAFNYHVYIGSPPVIDIQDVSYLEDMCVVLKGGTMIGETLRSDPIFVPATLIREAISRYVSTPTN
jgi:hypothetical protein